MNSEIILINNVSDLKVIPKTILESKKTKIYSFELQSHELLESKNIEHEIADNLLDENERLKLFNKMLDFRTWHSNYSPNDLEFEDVNLLKLFDTHEFHSYLMPIIINYILIKKIIEKDNPKKIISTNLFEKLILSIIKDNNIKTEFFKTKTNSNLLWDKITIKYNIGKIPISFNISKNKYLKLKKIAESTSSLFYDFWIDKNSEKKSIILLEFNPENFSNLLTHLKDYDGNIILINLRRSAIWSKKALDIVKNSNCKVINFDKILDTSQKEKLPILTEEYLNKFEKIWKNSEFFENFFQIENQSIWNIIKDDIRKAYEKKIPNFIQLIWSVKILFKNFDVRCIVSLNDVGETEKTILEFNHDKIPSILLEHGFIERVKETKEFDNLDFVYFKDKLAVWSETRKDWLSKEFKIDPNRILATGSPRHDDYFNSRKKKKNSKIKTILLAPNPIGDISGLSNIELKLRVNVIIQELFSIVKNLNNVQIFVKLHPIQLKHNEELKSLIKNLNNTISINLSPSTIEPINKADFVIVISPEIYGTSTMLLESMILGKPTMNIVFSKNILEYDHVKRNAVLTISDQDNLKKELTKFLFDNDFQEELIKNADNFIDYFLTNPGNASKNFSKILKSY